MQYEETKKLMWGGYKSRWMYNLLVPGRKADMRTQRNSFLVIICLFILQVFRSVVTQGKEVHFSFSSQPLDQLYGMSLLDETPWEWDYQSHLSPWQLNWGLSNRNTMEGINIFLNDFCPTVTLIYSDSNLMVPYSIILVENWY
jgi:hypothetical protein